MSDPTYRPPCEGKSYFSPGNRFHQGKRAEKTVLEIPNATTVANWNFTLPAAPSPATIDPYERPNGPTDECSGGPAACGGLGTGQVECGPNFVANTFGTPVLVDYSGRRSFKCLLAGFKNVWAMRRYHGVLGFLSREEPNTVSMTAGVWTFTSVYADPPTKKYLTYEIVVTQTRAHPCLTRGDCDGTAAEVAATENCTVSQTRKYSVNKLTGEVSLVACSDDNVISYSVDDCTVNDDGTVTKTGSHTATQTIDLSAYTGGDGLPGGLLWGIGHFFPGTQDPSNPLITSMDDTSITFNDGAGRDIETITWDVAAGSFSKTLFGYVNQSCHTDEDIVAGDCVLGTTQVETLDLTPSSLSYSITNQSACSSPLSAADAQGTDTTTVVITLSDENTSASVLDDANNNLLALWPLNDNLLYPWREDGNVKRGPLVTRKERGGDISPALFDPCTIDDYRSPIGSAPHESWNQMAWVDLSCYQWVFPAGTNESTAAATALVLLFDGSIVGAPYTQATGGGTAYPNKYWDGTHENDLFCPPADPDAGFWYPDSYGRYSVDDGMPATATQWTVLSLESNDGNANAALPGPQVRYDVNGTTGALVMKYAEIKQPLYSANFFRPSGADRYVIDPGTARCVVSTSGSGTVLDPYVVTLESGSSSIATTDLCRTRGDGSGLPTAVWQVTRSSDTVFTLTTKLYDLPPDSGIEDVADLFPTTDIFGKLRFPAAWPIEGAADVSAVAVDPADATKTIISCTPVPFLKVGDHVDFTGVALANNLAVSDVVDLTHFKVVATPSGAFGGPGAVFSHGAPSKFWFDDDPKGSYLVFEWTHDWRDIHNDPTLRTNQTHSGLAQNVAVQVMIEDCLPFSPCDPMVICVSPNATDIFPNGKTYAFPDSSALPLDGAFGTLWHAQVMTEMPDPYFTAPPIPCVFSEAHGSIQLITENLIDWREDLAGTCPDDNVADCSDETPCFAYYAGHPTVEALATPPTITGLGDAPALPAGIHTHFWTLAELNVAPVDLSLTGNVANPPIAGTGGVGGPWVNFLAKHLSIIGGSCRFAAEYKLQIIYC